MEWGVHLMEGRRHLVDRRVSNNKTFTDVVFEIIPNQVRNSNGNFAFSSKENVRARLSKAFVGKFVVEGSS